MFSKISIFVLLFSFCFSNNGFSQNGKITGSITDNNNAAVEMANLLLMSTTDSSLVKATASKSNGTYELENIVAGNYFINVVAFGFSNKQSEPFAFDGVLKEMATINISPVGTDLSEVQVVYTKPLIEVQADKTIMNVEGTINSTGLNVLELLRKAPGVVVDNNDNIMVKGKSGIQIWIDGKPTSLGGSDLANLLKGIQSTNIESIEIITNPSAKYDAAGTAGIINIKLKKNKNYGTNGSLTLGYGVQKYSKYNTSLSLNHRNKVVNLYGLYGNNWGERWNYMDFVRTQNDSVYDQETDNVNDDFNHNFKAGVDFYLHKNHTLGIMANGNFSKTDWTGKSYTYISDTELADTNRILIAGSLTNGNRKNFNYNLNYRFADTTGHSLTFDADYGTYEIRNNAYQPNKYYSGSEGILLDSNTYRSITPTDISIASVKADYEQNLWKGILGIGIKSSLVVTDNALDFFNIENGAETLDSSRTFGYEYEELINAAYINYNRKFDKWSIQTGFRLEQTSSRGILSSFTEVENKDVKRNYLDLFPSAAINYTANEAHILALTYSRRIDRPSYQDLNPFEFKLDELTFERGNPFLNPQYTHAIELTHTYQYSLNTSLSYSYTQDYFTNVTDTTNQEASYIQMRNLGSQDYAGINVSSPIPLGKVVNLFVNLGAGRLHNVGDFGENKKIDIVVWSYNSYAEATFKLPKDFRFEISGWYSGPGIWGGTFLNKPMGSMDIAAKKDFLDGNASLRVALGDVLNTSYWRSTSDWAGLRIVGRGGWESQQFRVNFTYRFGNQEMKVRERKGGADELGKRVK